MAKDQSWLVMRGDEVVAELEVESTDFPWLRARVLAHPALDEVRPLFDDDVRLLNSMDSLPDGPAEFEAAHLRIRETVRLLKPDGTEVPEFILHIDGAEAWWRWHDEPFPDTA